MAGIQATTKVNGGEVVLKNGQPTGLLIDNAMDIVEKLVPALADSLAVKYYLQAQDTCFRYGLTGVHDCGVNEKTIELVDQAQKVGKLQMKIYCLLTDSAQYYDRWVQKGPYITPNLHVGGFKVYADGALGSRGACLLASYTDKPNWKGFLLTDTPRLRTITQKLANSQLQLCTHAIGDSGNRVVLEMYRDVLKGKNDRRWRIEHAQVVQPSDLSLFQQFQIIPSVQPTHATSDMYWAAERLGNDRIHHAYAYQSLLKLNGWMPLGTDFPVEGIDPLRTFYAAVVRQDAKGWPSGGFQPEEALSRKEALWGMTLWAARSAFEEKEKGSLEIGKSADFVVLDQDIITCSASSLLQTKVKATYINGKKVF
jgi:predicted amidohydrolase YtcJ